MVVELRRSRRGMDVVYIRKKACAWLFVAVIVLLTLVMLAFDSWIPLEKKRNRESATMAVTMEPSTQCWVGCGVVFADGWAAPVRRVRRARRAFRQWPARHQLQRKGSLISSLKPHFNVNSDDKGEW